MSALSLREAAELAGTSRSSIFRAIKAGRLSANRSDAGEIRLDPAEVVRVYGDGNAPRRGKRISPERGEPEERNDLESHCAALEAENKALRELVARLDRDKADLQTERDKWSAQAERLALVPPRRSWWWFRWAS